jgi:hypothetical protein
VSASQQKVAFTASQIVQIACSQFLSLGGQQSSQSLLLFAAAAVPVVPGTGVVFSAGTQAQAGQQRNRVAS